MHHRSAWHVDDHVPILRRLRWESSIGFANLRFDTGPEHHLKWKCEVNARKNGAKLFDCDWVGNHIRPGTYTVRSSKEVWSGNKDEWWDSVELYEV